ncbi:MAG: histidine phosphatase family protein [Anaerolineaceae bacterium]|nr:histidine phosphatase family protein [Anaerolineaceae bacterium]
MKTLILMRHAKSSWKDSSLKDFDRPLKKRGVKNSTDMGKFLKKKKLLPEKILCSSAVRARQTVELLIDSSDYEGEVEYLESLYMAEPSSIMKLLVDLPNDLEHVMVVGHNPGLEYLLQILSNEVEAMPTAAVAHINIKIDKWKSLEDDSKAKLINLWLAKEIK